MNLVCLDLEGVLIPEVWVEFSKRTGIDELRLTTRDIPDYDVLMKNRLRILKEHQLRYDDIQAVIGELDPLPGARDFLDELRAGHQLAILSDTYYEFAMPLMRKLGYPSLFCHKLVVDEKGNLVDYRIRQKDPKRQAVKGFHSMKYQIVAAGDSYNDVSMLEEADAGILFRAPDNVKQEYGQYPQAETYPELMAAILEAESKFA